VCSYRGVYSVGSGFINPLFDPQKLLYFRNFFLYSDRTKYLSVGVYPDRGYDALLEFDGCKQTPILLKETNFRPSPSISPYSVSKCVVMPALLEVIILSALTLIVMPGGVTSYETTADIICNIQITSSVRGS
jgi:hypothetical protein